MVRRKPTPRRNPPPKGPCGLIGRQWPGKGRGGAALQAAVVVEPAERVAELAPGPVEDRGAPRGERVVGAPIRMVAQDRGPERGAQLGDRGRRLGPQHVVVV